METGDKGHTEAEALRDGGGGLWEAVSVSASD